MTIQLCVTNDPINKVSKNVGVVATLTGTLREPSSIIDPVITVEHSPTGFNYCYIPDFKRYYFVSNITVMQNGLIEMSCHVDVLKTYAGDIKSFEAIVQRQENSYNTYLDDGVFKAYQNSKHKVIAFPLSFNDFSYILAIAGNGSSE